MTATSIRNEEGYQVYIKSNEIFRAFFGGKPCNIPDVQDRIAMAVTEGSLKKKVLKKGGKSAFT
jgi:hypothetical protein